MPGASQGGPNSNPSPPSSDAGSSSSGADAGTPPSDLDGASSPPPAKDSGSKPPPTDSGSPAQTGVFADAPPFAAQSGGSGHHNSGKNCMNGCHDHGFTFAGTLFKNGQPLPSAEVRLVDKNGAAISVYSGTNGNFYSFVSFASPAEVGARDATSVVNMVAAVQGATVGCNGCHVGGGTAPPIHLP